MCIPLLRGPGLISIIFRTPALILLLSWVARATTWEVEAAVDVLDVRLVFCFPMHVYVKVGWCFLLGEWLRECLLKRHVMEITVGILRFRQ